jgi:hypothetical protein
VCCPDPQHWYQRWILYLDAEVDDGDVRVVEEVEDVRLAKVQLLELNVVDGGVGDGRARQLHVVQGPLPHRLVLHTIELSPAVFRIHEILVWIRIRGSMPLTNGSGSCYFRH